MLRERHESRCSSAALQPTKEDQPARSQERLAKQPFPSAAARAEEKGDEAAWLLPLPVQHQSIPPAGRKHRGHLQRERPCTPTPQRRINLVKESWRAKKFPLANGDGGEGAVLKAFVVAANAVTCGGAGG